MSTWRIPKSSTIICVALVLLLLIYVRPLTLLSMVRWKTRAKPELWIVPTPIADVSIEQNAGRNFIFYGYQFEVPWTDVKREEHLKSMELVYFSNNLIMMLHDPAQNVNQLKVLTGEGHFSHRDSFIGPGTAPHTMKFELW